MTDIGRAPSGQALVASDEARSDLHPSGFDPSRFQPNSYEGKPRYMPKNKRRELDALVNACRSHIGGLTPYRKGVLLDAMLSVSPINCSWQHFGLADLFVWELAESGIEAPSGGETGAGSTEGESPTGEAGDAQNHSASRLGEGL